SSSSRATASCPFSKARCSGVDPSLSQAETSAPLSSSSRATASCLYREATCSGVDPSLSVAETSAPLTDR
ncbi:hypothetical protein K440DRAFT_573951, partial [Wilcoxina mikolae CBS 423.85]